MRIVIVDDHPIVRSGLERVISREEDMEVVGTADSCPEGLEAIVAQKPDIAIVDYKIPGGDGFELIRRARKQVPDCRFIVLTSYSSQQVISRATSENVEGFILKEALPEELISAIRLVARGGATLTRLLSTALLTGRQKTLFRSLPAGSRTSFRPWPKA